MGVQNGFEWLLSGPGFLFAPDILDFIGRFGDIEATVLEALVINGIGVPVVIEFGWFITPVDKQKSDLSAGKRLDQDIDAVECQIPECRVSERILIDGQRSGIAQNIFSERLHLAKVVSCYQRGSHHAPDSHVRPVFGFCLVPVADLQHFKVVPMPRACSTINFHRFVQYLQNAYATPVETAIEAIADVGRNAP